MNLSIVSPVYRAEAMLESLVNRIQAVLEPMGLNYEILLVNDASPDNSWQMIEQICQKNPTVKGINLSRNFGQHCAITAGLSETQGDVTIVMDCDLQDRPEEIPHLLSKLDEGYDAVFAQRKIRQDGLLKRLSSRAFYCTFSYLTETKQDGSIANFGAYRRNVVDAILSMGDYSRYLPAMAQWVGFRQASIEVTHSEREEGKSSYTYFKLFQLAFNTIMAFSNKPIRLMTQLGFLIVLLCFLVTLYFLAKYFIFGVAVSGFIATILSIWFSTGVITTLIGSIGIYIGQIFSQVKNRPTFIIKDKINFDKDDCSR